jgi:hypothetical protein
MTNESTTPSTPTANALMRACQVVWPWMRWVILLIPVLATVQLIREYKVNIPFLDDYMFTDMLDKARHGFRWSFDLDTSETGAVLTLHDFYMVQMEHRLGFVRALILLRDHFWPTDITVENWFTFAFLLGTALNVGFLLKKTAGEFRQWWIVWALAAFAIFSPIQYQIILWAMMFQVACPAFFLSSTLAVLESNLPMWVRWVIGALCALCATMCIASGLLVWMLPIFVMLFGGVLRGRGRWWFIGLWVAVLGIVAFLYFHDIHNEVEGAFAYKEKQGETTMHRNLSAFVEGREKVVAFIFRVMGGHLERGSGAALMESSWWIGFVSTVLFVACCVWWIVRFKDEKMRQRLAPWIAFGSYTVATATLICLGRVWATSSGDNSISPRYTIHGVPLTVALCAMVWIIAADLRTRYAAWAARIEKGLLAGGLGLVCLLTLSWLQGMRLMETWSSARLRMATNTLFFKIHFANYGKGPDMDANIAANFSRAQWLNNELHVLKPAMLNDNRLSNFKIAKNSPLSINSAQWESLTVDTARHKGRAEGFAALAGRKRVADGVFLTYRDGDDWRIFHLGQVRAMPIYMEQTLERDLQNIQTPGDNAGENFAAFDSEFDLDMIPPGSHELAAWAFDYKEQTAYPIVGSFRLEGEKVIDLKPKKDPKETKEAKETLEAQAKAGGQ